MVPKVFSGIKNNLTEGIHISAEKETQGDKQEKRTHDNGDSPILQR